MSPNFKYLQLTWPRLAELCGFAEIHVYRTRASLGVYGLWWSEATSS
jgi:hypothetical protein